MGVITVYRGALQICDVERRSIFMISAAPDRPPCDWPGNQVADPPFRVVRRNEVKSWRCTSRLAAAG